MSENEQLQNPENQDEQDLADELDFLKDTARQLGIKFSNNIGIEALSEKISLHQAELAAQEKAAAEAQQAQQQPEPKSALSKNAHAAQLRRVLQAEALKLVRVRINNLDPKKNELKGEIITVGNDYVGTIKKMVPFGKATDGGYHIPMILYKYLKNKQYLVVRSTTHPVTKQITTETSWEREYSVEILDPLTEAQMKTLAQKQLAANTAD